MEYIDIIWIILLVGLLTEIENLLLMKVRIVEEKEYPSYLVISFLVETPAESMLSLKLVKKLWGTHDWNF